MNEYEMYYSGMSIKEVSENTGIPLSTLRFRFKKSGILRGRAEALRLAARRGRLGSGMRGNKRVFTDEWKKNISKSKTGIGLGVSLKPNGYLEITMGENKGRGVHVVVMEEYIGRRLLKGECVHHIDHNKINNEIMNLKLMSRSDHARIHALENARLRKRDKNGRFK